jgi:hypothetical protein
MMKCNNALGHPPHKFLADSDAITYSQCEGSEDWLKEKEQESPSWERAARLRAEVEATRAVALKYGKRARIWSYIAIVFAVASIVINILT